MDKSTLMTHMCADSRMSMQLLKGEEELQLKWVQDETDN